VIFLFIPLYAAAVLIGGCEFISTQFGIDYNIALLVFSVIIAAYVVMGGLKGVMYSDALQGSIMFIGMTTLLVFTYSKLGGVEKAHSMLSGLAPLVPGKLQAMGHRGWTAMPWFGFGDAKYDLWWIVVSTITLGVGIGVLAQPQLVVRFMTVKGKKELNRAVLVGGVFILIMTGVAFTVGSLSNAFFAQYGPPFKGRVAKTIDEAKGHVVLQLMKEDEAGKWADVEGKMAPVVLCEAELDQSAKDAGVVAGRSISIVYAKGNSDQIIPTYITSAMPKWFGLVFLLTLLAAAMSTLSSQFHTVGTSIGRDVYEQVTGRHGRSIGVNRVGIVLGIIIAMLWSYYAAQTGYIIARATAIFFGLCASAFLPTFIGGLFWRRMTRHGAICSMVAGFAVTAFWLLFVKAQEAGAIGLVQKFTGGKPSILADYPNWPVVDPLVVALPISIIIAVVVSLATKPSSKEHLAKCFAE
jgi:SSS family solute:Na+ symporter